MPTYTYRCTKCGAESEVVQSMSDPPLKRCKQCRGPLRRTFHPVGIVLKGSGFHRTDYRSPRPKSSSSDKEGSDTKVDTKDTKTESKETPSEKGAEKSSSGDGKSSTSSDG